MTFSQWSAAFRKGQWQRSWGPDNVLSLRPLGHRLSGTAQTPVKDIKSSETMAA